MAQKRKPWQNLIDKTDFHDIEGVESGGGSCPTCGEPYHIRFKDRSKIGFNVIQDYDELYTHKNNGLYYVHD
jgi:ssDNA-binding Zn-finger/Zn-ribbon topoisomerase 1